MSLTDKASLSHKMSMKEMTRTLNSNKAFLLKQRFLGIRIAKNSRGANIQLKLEEKAPAAI
jgi:hypothetical protein